ncbi:MAG: ParB/RepB/Spo0J family partition protein [Spirochaetes bacterium]|nr:ParB/RepB/Spo0J family partition protein [Spirochaetota bacterium]
MSNKKRVLGKGLSAIISESAKPIDEMESLLSNDASRIIELDVNTISPNPDQPRMHFNETELLELAESIKSVGLLQPILVRKTANGYSVIAGERRLRAAKLAGFSKIKAIVVDAGEQENLTYALIENIQRTNLDPIEEAKAYRLLINRFKLKQHEVAEKVGKDRATIANSLRLLSLPETIQHAISEGRISTGHAKALLSVPENRQLELFREIIKKGLSVRETEKLASSLSHEGKHKKKKEKNPHIKKMEEMLISILGTKVEVKHSGNRGKIEIYYYSLDDFERIIDILK